MRRFVLVPAFGLVLGAWVGLGVSAAPPDPPALGDVLQPNGGAPPGAGAGDGTAAQTYGGPTAAPAPNPYPVTPDAGAWLICAASYFGPDAPELARQLVVQIRGKHNLPAYVFNHADEERRKMREEFERLRREHPNAYIRRRTVRVPEQCAVLVGGYPDLDSASRALPAVRNLPMPELKLEEGKSPYDTMIVHNPDPVRHGTEVQRIAVNPFSTAFVTRNPTVPTPPKQVAKTDPFWKELNADEEYSLLNCPRPWTLAIKEYQGASVVQTQSGTSGFLKVLGMDGNKPGAAVSAATAQAHELAKVLRGQPFGFTTYVLHTRNKSIVTVGGFDGPNDPELQRVQRRLASLKFRGPDQKDPIGMFAVPMPMEVPRP